MSKYFRTLLLLSFLILEGCGCPNKYYPSLNPPQTMPCHVPEKVRVALVLGSGGVRGMAHVGVLEELEQAGLPIDLIVGCSAGSLVGAMYADHPCAAEIKQLVWSVNPSKILDINIWECHFGLSQGGNLTRLLKRNLNAHCFEELKIPFVAVATDLHSGELVPLGSGDIIRAVRASCSVPLVYVPVACEGRILVDGGVANPVPVRVARDLGAEYVVAVDLRELLTETFPTNLFEVASRSAEILFLWHNERCVRDADIIIRPTLCDIGTFESGKNRQIYEAGKRAARRAIPQIQELIAKLPPKQSAHSNRKLVDLSCYQAENGFEGDDDDDDDDDTD